MINEQQLTVWKALGPLDLGTFFKNTLLYSENPGFAPGAFFCHDFFWLIILV